jgi:D-alanyl-D-alanine dipeptidase
VVGLALAGVARFAAAAPSDDLVPISTVAPGVGVDLRYATTNNFLHEALYPRATCLLRRRVAERLAAVQRHLAGEGLGLLLWDCYRPLAIQRLLWARVHDPRYVADPKNGSRHNRGAAVDLTLVDREGRPLPMPTDFDELGPAAHRSAPTTPEAALNRSRLEAAMKQAGFVPLATEWWHFDAEDWRKYQIADEPL